MKIISLSSKKIFLSKLLTSNLLNKNFISHSEYCLVFFQLPDQNSKNYFELRKDFDKINSYPVFFKNSLFKKSFKLSGIIDFQLFMRTNILVVFVHYTKLLHLFSIAKSYSLLPLMFLNYNNSKSVYNMWIYSNEGQNLLLLNDSAVNFLNNNIISSVVFLYNRILILLFLHIEYINNNDKI